MALTRRTKFTAGFKAQVAVAALKGDKTVAGIAVLHTHGVHPAMVAQCQCGLEMGGPAPPVSKGRIYPIEREMYLAKAKPVQCDSERHWFQSATEKLRLTSVLHQGWAGN